MKKAVLILNSTLILMFKLLKCLKNVFFITQTQKFTLSYLSVLNLQCNVVEIPVYVIKVYTTF